jgi:hypothetical protein
MKENITRIAAWVLLSSKDPKKVSATVKSAAVGVAAIAGLFGASSEAILGLSEPVANAINMTVLAISAIGVVLGAVRKARRTLSGTNEVLNNL